ncbi:GTPase HflX [Desemzia sp. RIT804]|uniref:GTPase HflX n=1 Tax=Desemzia sp. RIT 804 TaxID=2810209 RepID=UPI00194E63F8|nr:GTPase HflX [Desemzia sp. RIT 804]MBM6614217.1 GTPase HflX [Desemzia sp. RIT 804]
METQAKAERVILVGVQTTETDFGFNYSLKELEQLTETAQGIVVGQLTQKRARVDSRTYLGKGKIEELGQLVEEVEADTVVFNHELTPGQTRNIQDVIEIKVIDRVQLILDIFAMHAKSKEGKLQVELAQLQYLLPRLAGQGVNLSRLGGGIGTRGPGETKLETDRRYIRDQINDIRKELSRTEKHRELTRKQRKESNIFQIGLIGYTNAGKSTLLNKLTNAETYEENKLFATLDPLTRQLKLPSGLNVTVTDTVGFIQDLPTQLIEAFHSTLEETRGVDLLLHVVDASAENMLEHERTVMSLLMDLKMDHLPILTIYNKSDLIEGSFYPDYFPNIVISARNDQDIELLVTEIMDKVEEIMEPYRIEIPVDEGDVLIQLKQETQVATQVYDEEKNVYVVKGYAKAKSRWIGESKKE